MIENKNVVVEWFYETNEWVDNDFGQWIPQEGGITINALIIEGEMGITLQ